MLTQRITAIGAVLWRDEYVGYLHHLVEHLLVGLELLHGGLESLPKGLEFADRVLEALNALAELLMVERLRLGGLLGHSLLVRAVLDEAVHLDEAPPQPLLDLVHVPHPGGVQLGLPLGTGQHLLLQLEHGFVLAEIVHIYQFDGVAGRVRVRWNSTGSYE